MLPEVLEAHEVTTGEDTLLVPFLIFPFLSFLSLAVGVTQASAWARILHESSNAAVLAESSRSSQPEARKSLLASFLFSATVFAQVHSCSYSLNLQIIFSQLCDP